MATRFHGSTKPGEPSLSSRTALRCSPVQESESELARSRRFHLRTGYRDIMKTMKVTQPPLGEIGVEIVDLDLKAVTSADVQRLFDLVYEKKIVVFRNQDLSNEDYLAMARKFGRPQIYHQANYHHPEHPEIFVSSNVPDNGKKVGVAGTGKFWHTDYSFFDEPLSTTFVYPKILPKLGRRYTSFIDMEKVLKDLPEHLMKHVVGTRSFHEATWYYKIQPKDIDRAIIDLVKEFREMSPGAWHPTAITHPVRGTQSLYISEGFTTAIEGYTHEEAKAAIAELCEFVERPEHHMQFNWHDGDVMWWDNRTLIHRASETVENQPSMSYRIGVYDAHPFYVEG